MSSQISLPPLWEVLGQWSEQEDVSLHQRDPRRTTVWRPIHHHHHHHHHHLRVVIDTHAQSRSHVRQARHHHGPRHQAATTLNARDASSTTPSLPSISPSKPKVLALAAIQVAKPGLRATRPLPRIKDLLCVAPPEQQDQLSNDKEKTIDGHEKEEANKQNEDETSTSPPSSPSSLSRSSSCTPSSSSNSSSPTTKSGAYSYHRFQGTAKQQHLHRCPICTKVFTRPSALRCHTYSHSKDKPFECPQLGCGRRFNVRSNMRRHMRTHKERDVEPTPVLRYSETYPYLLSIAPRPNQDPRTRIAPKVPTS